MRLITLDFKDIKNEKELHQFLKDKLELPEYYGHNLDALWDSLTEIRDYTLIELKNIDCLYDK